MNKYSFSDIYDGVCTAEQYTAQFPAAKIEVGKTYLQHPGEWNEQEYKILFVDDRIAIGISKDTFIKGTTDYTLFYSTGLFEGWKYNDTARPGYRLQPPNDCK